MKTIIKNTRKDVILYKGFEVHLDVDMILSFYYKDEIRSFETLEDCKREIDNILS